MENQTEDSHQIAIEEIKQENINDKEQTDDTNQIEDHEQQHDEVLEELNRAEIDHLKRIFRKFVSFCKVVNP